MLSGGAAAALTGNAAASISGGASISGNFSTVTVRRHPHPGKLGAVGVIGDNHDMPNVLNAVAVAVVTIPVPMPAPVAVARPSSQSTRMSVETVDDLRRRCASKESGGRGESIAENARRLGRSETAIRRAVRGQGWQVKGGGARSYKDATAPEVAPRPNSGSPRYGADVVAAVKASVAAASAVAAQLGVSERWVRWVRKGGRS